MSNHKDAISIIKAIVGQANILTIPRQFVDYVGSLDGALFLSQVLYWSDRGRGGWFYKTYAEWQEEICLSEYEVKKAAKKLIDLGVLETQVRKANGNPTVHYRLDFDAFSESFLNFLQKRNPTNSGIESRESEESLTEITTETTTKNLGANAPSDALAANAAPFAEFSIVEGDHILSCVCGEDVVLQNLKRNAAECPRCHIGLYVYDANGTEICQPPQGKRKAGRTKRVLSDLMPCQPGWENIPYYARDKAVFELLYKTVRDDLVSAIGWAVAEYTKGKMEYHEIVACAIKATQKRMSIIAQSTGSAGKVIVLDD